MSGADRAALLARTHVGVRELVAEAIAGVGQRPLRSTLTGLGAAIGVCAVVAVLGLTATASAQVNERFDELRAREVSVRPVEDEGRGGAVVSLDSEAAGQVAALPGVVAAGTVGLVPLDDVDVRTVPHVDGAALGVRSVSAAAWDVLRARVSAGRVYDAGHESRADRVVVLGVGAAERLGVQRLDAVPAVFVNGVAFTVVGVVDDVGRAPDLLGAVMMPASTAESVWSTDEAAQAQTELLVETQVGAATAIAAHLPHLLEPGRPDALRVDAPPDPRALGSSIGADLDVLSLALAAVSVALGALGISNTMLVTVMERVHEIGLRRALGASGGHIGVQFLVEAAVLGGIGGLVGSGVGVIAVVLTAAFRDWTPVLASWVVVAAPVLGLVSGLVAGVFPALRAARVQPADALRR